MNRISFLALLLIPLTASTALQVHADPAPQPLAPLSDAAADSIIVHNETSFVADGAVRTAIAQSDAGSPATGSLGIIHTSLNTSNGLAERFSSLLAVASTGGRVVGATPSVFASVLLTAGPSGEGSGRSGILAYEAMFWKPRIEERVGLHLYGSFATYEWLHDAGSGLDSAGTSILTLGARLKWLAISSGADNGNNTFEFCGEAGLTSRFLAGDILQANAFRKGSLGISDTKFYGPELAFSIRLRQVTGSAVLPWLQGSKGGRLTGLTGLQPIVTFSIEAPLFTFVNDYKYHPKAAHKNSSKGS